jgi:hypothetical protein
MTRAWRLLALSTCWACSQASGRPTAATATEPSRAIATKATETKATETQALPARPEHSACTVRDQVPLGGVAWPLRTRLDAVPTLVVEEARVTAWLSPGKRKYRPYAFSHF